MGLDWENQLFVFATGYARGWIEHSGTLQMGATKTCPENHLRKALLQYCIDRTDIRDIPYLQVRQAIEEAVGECNAG